MNLFKFTRLTYGTWDIVYFVDTLADFRPDRLFAQFVALSPDGTRVAYADNASGQYNLVVQEVGGNGSPVRLTAYTDNTVRKAVWTPDGERLIFLIDTRGDESYQLRSVAAKGGPVEVLTDSPGVQYELGDVSPDGRWLSYAGNDRDPSVKEMLYRDLTTGENHRVSSGGGHMFPGPWSADSRRFSATDWRSNIDEPVYVATRDGEAVCLRSADDVPSRCEVGPWLGDSILVITDAGREFAGIARMDTGDGTLTWLVTPDMDVEHVALSRDERILVWTLNDGGISRLCVRDLASGQDRSTPPLPQGVITHLSLSDDGSLLALRLSTATKPTNIMMVHLDTGRVGWLTDAATQGSVQTVEPTLVSFASFDGRSIPALLYRPSHKGTAGVAVHIHGGPEFQERPVYQMSGLYQYLVSRGVAVLAPNVRGSTGYGRQYQQLIHHDLGGGDLRDFEAVAQYLRNRDWVDPDRIGVFGASYGGFAVLSCLSRLPQYWACGVSRFGMSNLVTLVRSVPATWHTVVTSMFGDPETETDFLMSRSPITYADNIVAPLFVIQGANDPRVVKNESDQIVERLRQRGVQVRYDVYPDEGHGFTKVHNEAKAFGDTADFLVEHLG